MPSFCSGHDEMMTISKHSSPTLFVICITIGVASTLIIGPVSVINSTPVFPHMVGDGIWVKNLSEISLNQGAPRSGSSWNDLPSCSETDRRGMDSLVTHYNTWLCWVLTSRKRKVNAIRLVSERVVWKYLGE